MNKTNIKIIGAGPTGSLLAIFLASEKFNITIIEPLSESELLSKDKGYAITQSSKKIFEEIGLWNIIEKVAVGFSSLSIIDDELSQSVLVRNNDLKSFNRDELNIGWVVEHKDLMNILIDKIRTNNFIKKFKSDDINDNNFDFILAADGRDSSYRKLWKINYLKRYYNQRCISFKALLKGAPRKRAYEIFRHEGPLALLPLNNDIYQVIWFSSRSETQLKLKLTKLKLLNKLESILPDQIRPEKIISDISSYSVIQAFALPKFSKYKNILVGDAAHSFHPVGGQGLNSCIRDIFELTIAINRYKESNYLERKLFSLSFFLQRLIDILSLIIFTDFLVKLFSNKIVLLYPMRLLIFYMLRKFKYIRTNVFSLMTDSIKRYKFYN